MASPAPPFRYSHALARKGYQVNAVELIEHNIDVFRKNTASGEPVTITQGNAMDLSAFGSHTYDITLLLGPMYHLFTAEDRLKAPSEAVRVAKRGGVVFAAYCMSDASILQRGFLRGNIRKLMENSMVDPETFETFSSPKDLFEMHRKEDIDALRGRFPVTQLHFMAADGFAYYMRETLYQMDDETHALYLRYHFTVCERADMIGYSNHTLDISRKDGGCSHS